MTNPTMQQAAEHHFGIAWDELSQFEQAHWEAAYRAGQADVEAVRKERDWYADAYRGMREDLGALL